MNNEKRNFNEKELNETLNFIQEQIDYRFKKRELLLQALTRKSYSEENEGTLNNEVLEFYGDKALDFVVMKKMSEYFRGVGSDFYYISTMSEGKLTEIKGKLVCREMLAHKIRALGFQGWMILGKGDIEQKVWEQESAQEDLFEAIVGAVAMDSNWDVDILTKVVDLMLDPDFYFENGFDGINYIEQIQQWFHKKRRRLPIYNFTPGFGCYQCKLLVAPFGKFQAVCKTKNGAKLAVAKMAYEFLEERHWLASLADEVGNPDFERAVNQLQELFQKGYIEEPKYDFSETHDENGNPVWQCDCHVPNFTHFCRKYSSSKKQGKKMVAYEMVKSILNWEESDET